MESGPDNRDPNFSDDARKEPASRCVFLSAFSLPRMNPTENQCTLTDDDVSSNASTAQFRTVMIQGVPCDSRTHFSSKYARILLVRGGCEIRQIRTSSSKNTTNLNTYQEIRSYPSSTLVSAFTRPRGVLCSKCAISPKSRPSQTLPTRFCWPTIVHTGARLENSSSRRSPHDSTWFWRPTTQ